MADKNIGQTINGKYRLLSVLGAGAMGIVHRAEQLDAEGRPLREVAFKMVGLGSSGDSYLAQRLLREIRVAAKLRSPHIVAVYDAGQAEAGQLYYTMELIRGPTLQQAIQRQGPFPVERAIRVAEQICEALAEAHSQPESIVHRDLKPANIFLEEHQGREWVKIGDFGIAKVLGRQTTKITRMGTAPGTPLYMAPEQWSSGAVDGRADLYALGIIMYEMLTGKPPFAAQSDIQTLRHQHLNTSPLPLPNSVPIKVRSLVEQLLAKDAQQRPADALTVRRLLEISAIKPGRSLWKYAVGVSVIVLSLLIWGVLRHRQQTPAEPDPQTPKQQRGNQSETAPGVVPPPAEVSVPSQVQKEEVAEKAKRLALIQDGKEPPLQLDYVVFLNTTKEGKMLSDPADSYSASEVQFMEWQAVFDNRLYRLTSAFHRMTAHYYTSDGRVLGTVEDEQEVAAESDSATFRGRIGRAGGGTFAPGTYRVDLDLKPPSIPVGDRQPEFVNPA